MSCDAWREKLEAYVDDPLANEAAGVEEHLRSCPSCAAEVLNRVQLKRATRAAAMRYAPSPEFRLRVEKTIRPKRRAFRPALWIPAFTAAMSMLLLFVGVALWDRHHVEQEATAELVDMHVATLASANPVDVVSTDRHTVKPWFQGKLPFTFNIPELANSPYKLVGGKLIYVQDQPAAQLLFELRKHELSVFIFQPTSDMLSTGESEAREKGFSVESWKEGGLRYVIVSDSSPADAHELANLLRSALRQ